MCYLYVYYSIPDPPRLYRRVHLHFLVLWDWVKGVHLSLYGHIHTVLRSGVDVWPTSINKDFRLAVLSCEHLQYRLLAYLEGYLKVICFLSWFCEEQSVASSVNFLIKCQENDHWNKGRGKDCFSSGRERKHWGFANAQVFSGSQWKSQQKDWLSPDTEHFRLN